MQDFEKNLETLLEALKFSPDNLPLKKHVAEMLLQAGQTERAIQFFKEILARGDDYDSLVNLGRAYSEQEETSTAIVVWEKALALRPDASDLCLRLSKLHLALNHVREASEYYQKARKLDSMLADAKYEEQLLKRGTSPEALNPQPEQERVRVSNTGSGENDLSLPDDLLERPTITFRNVGGLSELKEHIRMNIIYPFQNPALFRSFGKQIGGGILMYGPRAVVKHLSPVQLLGSATRVL